MPPTLIWFIALFMGFVWGIMMMREVDASGFTWALFFASYALMAWSEVVGIAEDLKDEESAR